MFGEGALMKVKGHSRHNTQWGTAFGREGHVNLVEVTGLDVADACYPGPHPTQSQECSVPWGNRMIRSKKKKLLFVLLQQLAS